MIWFIIASILMAILFFFLMYRRKEPCIHFYEGSLGLGKTLLCVNEGKRLYKKNVAKWRRDMKKRRRYGRIHNLDVEYLEPMMSKDQDLIKKDVKWLKLKFVF